MERVAAPLLCTLGGFVLLLGALVSTPVRGQQADPTATTLFDLFIYADRSASVFTPESEPPAANLVQMIRNLIIPGSEGSPVLIGPGSRIAIRAFGDLDGPAGETLAGNVCADDIQPILPLQAAANLAAVDDALATYLGIGRGDVPELQTTNFECLFADIGANADIRESLERGRQPIILIASDFLHDPFNRSGIPPADGQVAAGQARAGAGICELDGVYTRGDLPLELDRRLTETTDLQEFNPDVNPLFGLLTLELSVANFSNPASAYAACALGTSERKLFEGLLQARLDAETFGINDDPGAFRQRFERAVTTRLGPKPSIANASAMVFDEGEATIALSFRHVGQRAYRGEALLFSQAGRSDRIGITEGTIGVRPGENPSVRLPLVRRPTGIDLFQPFDLSVALVDEENGRTLGTDPFSVAPERQAIVFEKPPRYVAGPGFGYLIIDLENTAGSPLGVTAMTLEASGFGTASFSTANARLAEPLSPGEKRSARVDLVNAEQKASAASGRSRLTIRSAPTDGRVATSTSRSAEVGPADQQQLQIDAIELVFEDANDPQPTIRIDVVNPNTENIPLSVTSVTLSGVGSREVNVPLDQPVDVQAGLPMRIEQDVDIARNAEEADSIFAFIRQSIRQDRLSVVLEPNGVRATSVPARVEQSAVLVCPSPDRLGTIRWDTPFNNRVDLVLTFEAGRAIGLSALAYDEVRIDSFPEPIAHDNKSNPPATGDDTVEKIAVTLPFSTASDTLALKHFHAGQLRIRFLRNGQDICQDQPILVDPHARNAPPTPNDPQDLEVSTGSFEFVQILDGQQTALRFGVTHKSAYSFFVLNQVTLVSNGTEAERTLDGVRVNGQPLSAADHYFIAPRQDVRTTVDIPLAANGIEPETLRNKGIRLIGQVPHLLPSGRGPPREIPIPPDLLDNLSVEAANWIRDTPAIDVRLVSQIAGTITRAFLASTDTGQPHLGAIAVAFEQPVVLETNSNVAGRLVIPRSALTQTDSIIGQDDVYVCVPPPDQPARWCQPSSKWERVQGLRETALAFSADPPSLDVGSGEYSVSIRNDGPYAALIYDVRFLTEFGEALPGAMANGDPFPVSVPPAEQPQTLQLTVPDREDYNRVLEGIRFRTQVVARDLQPNETVDLISGYGFADPPRLTFGPETVSVYDDLKRAIYRLDFSAFGLTADDGRPPPLPYIEGDVLLERQRGTSVTNTRVVLALLEADGGRESDQFVTEYPDAAVAPPLDGVVPYHIQVPTAFQSDDVRFTGRLVLASDPSVDIPMEMLAVNSAGVIERLSVWSLIQLVAVAIAVGVIAILVYGRLFKKETLDSTVSRANAISYIFIIVLCAVFAAYILYFGENYFVTKSFEASLSLVLPLVSATLARKAYQRFPMVTVELLKVDYPTAAIFTWRAFWVLAVVVLGWIVVSILLEGQTPHGCISSAPLKILDGGCDTP